MRIYTYPAVVALISVLLASWTAGCGRKPATSTTPGAPAPPSATTSEAGKAEGTLTIKGSDTMLQLGQALAEKFMEENPNVTITVTGGGSGTGIAALINGTCDIAQASRRIKDEESRLAQKKGFKPKEIQIASDGLSVVVNNDNPVDELTIDQIADIFTGKTTNWSQVGGDDVPIVVLSRDTASGTHVYFKEHVLNKGNKQGKAEYTPSALMLPSNDQIHNEVAKNPKAIGYIGLGYVDEDVKPLKVAAKEGEHFVAPSQEAIVSGDYPIARPLLFYTRGEPEGLTKTYINWVLGTEGQKVVQEQDFVPLASGG